MEQISLLQYTFLTGFVLGGVEGSQRASLQFLAEHQHEQLKKRSHFVAFHRTRNYRILAAFGIGGAKRGVQLAAVAAAYLAMKEGLQYLREKTEIKNSLAFADDFIACSALGGTIFALGSKENVF